MSFNQPGCSRWREIANPTRVGSAIGSNRQQCALSGLYNELRIDFAVLLCGFRLGVPLEMLENGGEHCASRTCDMGEVVCKRWIRTHWLDGLRLR